MIITSLLDTDLYKLTMQQAVFHHFSTVNVEYTFKCRTPNIDLKRHVPEITNEILQLCDLTFNSNEIAYLKSLGFFKDDYLYFLKNFKLNMGNILLYHDSGELKLKVIGSWLDTILFETPILATISEIYMKQAHPYPLRSNLLDMVGGGISRIKNSNLKFADFGTRRRFSKQWHDTVIWYLQKNLPNFVGTSNLMFARKYGIKPVGTMAHEWLQAGQALTTLENSQRFMLYMWLQEYRNSLGIVLTDVITMDSFLKDFDLSFSIKYTGCRQDSGNPFDWCNKLINHYEKLGINPKTKTAIFSDGLDFSKAWDLYAEFKDKINVLFGIGTSLTNNVGTIPIQIVMKITKCNNQPVAKISDSPGKGMCENEAYLDRLKQAFGVRQLGVEIT
jgi:nicotinate phosphoribosyltransferase